MKHIVTLEEFLERLKAKHGDSIEYVSGFKNMNTKCMFKCKIDGHTWFAVPSDILRGHGCPECSKRKRIEKNSTPLDKMLEEVKVVWGDSIIYIEGYINKKIKCKWLCKECGTVWWSTPCNILRGYGCKKCGYKKVAEKNTLSLEDVIKRIEILYEGKIEYISGYINTKTKCKWRCKVCRKEWEAVPNSLFNGHGCPICAIEKHRLSLEELIKRVTIKYNGKIEYVSDYTYMNKKCKWRCKECGYEWYSTPNTILKSIRGCPSCAIYSMEKPVREFLDKKHISYIYNKGIKGCNFKGSRVPLKLDFLIKTNKGFLAIETDGQQHFNPIHGENNLKDTQEKDKYKNQFLKEIGWVLIRVTSSKIKEWGTLNHITLIDLFNLFEKGTDENGNVNLDVFKPYDYNRE